MKIFFNLKNKGLLINESIIIGAQSEAFCLNQNSYCQIQKKVIFL